MAIRKTLAKVKMASRHLCLPNASDAGIGEYLSAMDFEKQANVA